MTKRPRIVVVEDDDQFRTVLIKRLQTQNYDVAAAEDGMQGWEVINKFHPDLIVSDLMMPGMDGQELCRRVKSAPELEHIYFMMLTARDSIDDCVAGLETGADDYLSKPVNNKELMARIRAGLRISSLYNQVKASEQKYRALIENASDAILQFDVNGRCVEANERACQIIGYTKEEMLALDFADLLPVKTREFADQKFAAMCRIGNFIEEIEMERKDSIVIPVESATTLIETEAGVICQCIVRDLTRRKEVEQQLIQVEKLRALGGMVGGIAHDFNNLLAAILGYTELALRDALSAQDETLVRRLKFIEKAALDGAETVRLLQEFTKVRKESRKESVSVNKLLQQVLLLTRHRWRDAAQSKGIAIRIKADYSEIPLVQGNLAELREAFTNIIFNAIDAIPADGQIYCRTWANGDYLQVSISDTGVGMSEDVRQRIFDPFFTTKGISNSGLGLSVCYGIINRHGGEILVESALGKGSTFTIKLPILGPVELKTESDQPSLAVSANVLIIDDESLVRGMIQELLEDEGHRVVSAESGKEGVEKFGHEKFDLVITDLGMPGMTGWDVVARIKEIDKSVPVVLLTGWSNEPDNKRAKDCGVDLVLGKPISSKDLISIVTNAVERKLKS
ncbi:MAG: response regulator [Acidobacteriota bacterium]